MSATSGRIEPLMLFKVFRSMLERRLGGVLTVQRGQVIKKARFAAGLAVQVASNRPEESTARALVEEGLISSTEQVEIDNARRVDKRSFEAVEFATLEWVDWFNHRRLLEPIGNLPPAEAKAACYAELEAVPIAA